MHKDHLQNILKIFFVFSEEGWGFLRIIYQYLCCHSLYSTLDIGNFENILQKHIQLFEVGLKELMLNIQHLRKYL